MHNCPLCYSRARRITPLSNKKTLDGIWFLILIAYVYTFDTCFNLLRCTASTVHSDNFSKTEFHSLVRVLANLNGSILNLICRFISTMAVLHVLKMNILYMQ